MTREEQIKQQAMSVIGVPPELSLLECFRMGFKEGAKWADNNPKEYREKIEQLEIKYFELFKKARQEDKEKLIAEACRWLEDIDFEMTYIDGDGLFDKEKFIIDITKVMEDLK